MHDSRKTATIVYTTVGAVLNRHYYMNVYEGKREVRAMRLDYLFQVSEWLEFLKKSYRDRGYMVTVLKKHGGRWVREGD